MLTALLVLTLSQAQGLEGLRRVTAKELSNPVQRVVLDNGLVVLLAPDPSASHVAVDVSFRAGTAYEPQSKSGVAHLTEHVVATGVGADDYRAQAEARGLLHFNAITDFEFMSFTLLAPPAELPFALWLNEQRLGGRLARVDDQEIERNRRIVGAEREQNLNDPPYALANKLVFKAAFVPPHPLGDTVFGSQKSLAALTRKDVVDFGTRHLVMKNAVLSLAGRFEPAVALDWVRKTLGTLPAGEPVPKPALQGAQLRPGSTSAVERLSRRPRVSLVWNFEQVPLDSAEALRFAALLVDILSHSYEGLEATTTFVPYVDSALFRVDVVFAYDLPPEEAKEQARGLLRQITERSPREVLLLLTKLAWDAALLRRLDGVDTHAALSVEDEWRYGKAALEPGHGERHWFIDARQLRDTLEARSRLGHVVVHARPTSPRPAPREEP